MIINNFIKMSCFITIKTAEDVSRALCVITLQTAPEFFKKSVSMTSICMLITKIRRSLIHTCYPTLGRVKNPVVFSLNKWPDKQTERGSSHKLIIHHSISINLITFFMHIIAQLLDRQHINAYNENRHDVENICSYNASLNVHNLS